eukprot:4459529-Prorocentrum_lima.AAC.1
MCIRDSLRRGSQLRRARTHGPTHISWCSSSASSYGELRPAGDLALHIGDTEPSLVPGPVAAPEACR